MLDDPAMMVEPAMVDQTATTRADIYLPAVYLKHLEMMEIIWGMNWRCNNKRVVRSIYTKIYAWHRRAPSLRGVS